MTNQLIRRAARIAALTLGLIGAFTLARAETLVGTNVDNRVIVGFTVNQDALGQWVPDGWTAVPFPSGPLKGSNLLLVLIDRQLQLDAEGNPADPANSRSAVMVGLGKETEGDAVRLYVYRLYTSDPAPNPYSNSIKAEIARQSTTSGAANDGRDQTEDWTIGSIDGNKISLSLSFTTGKRSWGPGEANPFSNTNLGFSRIYRYNQLVDVAMSEPLGKPLAGSFEFQAEGPELDALFDGNEKTVAIMDIPVYTRQVFLP